MNANQQPFNNQNLLNLQTDLKQRYQQIYQSNKLQLLQVSDLKAGSSHFGQKKFTKYKGSNRILDEDQYAKLINLSKQNELVSKSLEPKQKDYRYSETDSLSFIQENEKSSIKIMDSMLWHELLKQQQDIFQILDYEDFIITSFNGEYQCFNNVDILIDEGKYSKILQGFCFQRRENIAVKFQAYNTQELVENQYQYSLHHFIYSLYPNTFLRIDYPIYVNQSTADSIEIVSKYEIGLKNLYKYCLENKIDDKEMNLIYKQVLQQVLLMHKHNIAHRDIKPQNIIFVKGKGWLLCDFEFSMKYQNQIVVCSIKGTKQFLPPYLYRQSNVQGAIQKQDLFFNDQYALGVTLVIIKYQIQNSNDLKQQLINETDPNILFLLKQSQKDELYQENINYEVSFVEPEISAQVTNVSQTKLKTDQLISIIKSLQKFGSQDKELRDKLIKIIDQNLWENRDDYFYINFSIHESLTIYLPMLKNIIDTRILKTSKCWERFLFYFQFQFKNLIESQLNTLKFLQTLGLYETLIIIGKQLIYQNYNLAIHVLIARMLYFLNELDLVYQEYQQMLKIKEFQYLTSIEQSEFISFTLQLFHWNLIDEADIQYIQQFYFNEKFQLDQQVTDLYDHEGDTKERFLNYICNHYKEQNTYKALFQHCQDFIMKLGSTEFIMSSNHCLKLYEIAFEYLELDDMIKFDQLMVNQMKYFTFSVQFQQLLKQSLFLQFLKTQTRSNYDSQAQKNQLLKSINFSLLFYSESEQQQLVLNLIKQCSIFIYQIKTYRKLNQIIQRVSNLCEQFHLLNYKYYKTVFQVWLSQILFDTRIHTQESRLWFRIAQWQTKMVHELVDNSDFGFHYDNMINYWISVRNQRRHDKLVEVFQISPGGGQIKQRYEYKVAQIYDSIPILLKFKKLGRLTSCFLYQQNLYR